MGSCSRREFGGFLCGAGLGLVACGSSTPTLTPAGQQLTLTYAQFPALANSGGSAVVDVSGGFPLLVVRTGEGTAVALSATCTHEACILRYEAGPSELHCDCHGANFALSGAVLGGPTNIPLPVYAATPGADAIVVDLS